MMDTYVCRYHIISYNIGPTIWHPQTKGYREDLLKCSMHIFQFIYSDIVHSTSVVTLWSTIGLAISTSTCVTTDMRPKKKSMLYKYCLYPDNDKAYPRNILSDVSRHKGLLTKARPLYIICVLCIYGNVCWCVWEHSRGTMLCRARLATVTAAVTPLVTPCTSASPRKRERDITMLDFFTLCARYNYNTCSC